MSVSWPAINNDNVSATSRKMWIESVISQVIFKMPMFTKMYLSGSVVKKWDGGTMITRPIKTANMKALAQDFGSEDALTGGRVTMLNMPSFRWKRFQLPIVYTHEEMTMNSGPNRVVDFSRFLVESGQEGARIHLYELAYNNKATTETNYSNDTGKVFQSILQALDHGDATTDIGYSYGNLTRDISAGTNDVWQSADIEDSFDGTGVASVQDTEITASIANFRKAMSVVRRSTEPTGDYLCVMGPTLHQAFQSQVGSGVVNTKIASQPGDLVRYGFNSFTIDNVEFVEDTYLRNANVTNAHKWFFIFHIPSWEMRFKPGEMFRITPFQDQAVMINGYPQSLARVYCEGNFMCWRPKSNMWLSNMVA